MAVCLIKLMIQDRAAGYITQNRMVLKKSNDVLCCQYQVDYGYVKLQMANVLKDFFFFASFVKT